MVLHESTPSESTMKVHESTPEFPLQKFRPLNPSRGLTTAVIPLRLYIASENFLNNISILCEYALEVYVPVGFLIKTKPRSSD